jgi:hypothetical protein
VCRLSTNVKLATLETKILRYLSFRRSANLGVAHEVKETAGTKQEQGRQITLNVTVRRVRESLLPWKRNKYYIFVCACVRACSLVYTAYNSYAPYSDVICGPSGSTIFFDIIS